MVNLSHRVSIFNVDYETGQHTNQLNLFSLFRSRKTLAAYCGKQYCYPLTKFEALRTQNEVNGSQTSFLLFSEFNSSAKFLARKWVRSLLGSRKIWVCAKNNQYFFVACCIYHVVPYYHTIPLEDCVWLI